MMNKISFTLLIVVCAIWGCTEKKTQQTKKNLLFIITDQQNYFTLKDYGNKIIKTPNLDALAKESFVFKNTYVSQPVCSPARGTILSGVYPHTHGVLNNDSILPKNILTLPELVKDPDYKKAYIGKWHLGDEIFKQRGFDTWVSMEDLYYDEYSEGRDSDERSDYHKWLLEKGYTPKNTKKNRFGRKYAASLPIEHCKPTFLQENATKFLDQVHDQPFIMYVSFLEPHMPFTGPLDSLYNPNVVVLPENFNNELGEDIPLSYRKKREKEINKYGPDEQNYRQLIARYWGLVSQVDRSVGVILNKLDSLGLSDNTIVVFTSDHGTMMGAHKIVNKDVMYEESIRVPFLLKDSDLTSSKRIVHERFSQIDLVPTLLDLLGNDIPDHLTGNSIVPTLKGEESLTRDIFIEWPDTRTIVTQDGWKLAFKVDGQSLLFDLNSDPHETRNLFYQKKYQQKVKDLTGRIKQWQIESKDNLVLPDLD
ncbi:sulfatase family protein [Marinifilum caeruleilacunae]|uniref:Sulfatase N-terminal domain-containing protein n=1 Tax=Marinifilum caeruleilacunae TaxID=2499076 RepID=A0ABX1WZK0_9BACT|nr:sulfatase-like hydrolase/transferase [Marinifilum caeruleilacunae]NOU61298.1 hypothetical protein [Marinifilum caeruleilacunae]